MKKLCFFLAAMLLFSGPNTVKNALPDIETEQAGVDLMLVVAHPGDEYLYLGGVLSYYVSQLGDRKSVV